MFKSNKKSDNKSSSSSSSAKTTNGASQKYTGSSAGAAASSKFTMGSSSKPTSSYGGNAWSKSTTTTSSSLGSKYPTSSSSTTQKTSSTFGALKTDAMSSKTYGKPTTTSSYKSSSFVLSSPKITDFSKTQLERRPLTTNPYSSSTTMSKTTAFPMPSSLETKTKSKYESSHASYHDFENELRKHNIGSSSENYEIYKTFGNQLPIGMTAAKLTTRINKFASSQVRNQQTTSTTHWSSGGNPALKGTLVTGALAASQVPSSTPKPLISKFDESRTSGFSTSDPRKPVAVAPSAPKEVPNDIRPLDDNNRYVCSHHRGYGVIYNFENFQTAINGSSRRDGTQNDVKVLERLFAKYNVRLDYSGVKKDLTLKELKKSIHEIEKKNLKDYDCLVVVILSHGSANNSISAKDQLFNLEDTVVGPITNNKTLKGKPKIFIIQACRGDQNPLLQADSTCFRLGFDATDIMKCFSTYTNQVAFRDPANGSIFVQTFSKYVSEYGERYHIADIMEKVCQEVNRICKQTPEQTSTLTKKFYFGDLLK